MEDQKKINESVPGYISLSISFKKNLYLTYKILKNIKFSFLTVAMFSIISAVAELLGVIIIFTYVHSFLEQSNEIVSEKWQAVFILIKSITNENVFIFSLVIVLTVVGKSLVGIATNFYSARECFSAQEKIAVRLTKIFINNHDTNDQNISIGDAVNRIFNENERFINSGVLVLAKLWGELVTTLSLIILLLYSDPTATMTLILVFIIISIIYLIWTNGVMNKLGIAIAKHTAMFIGSITNIVLGIDEIKQLDKDGFFLNKVRQTAIGFKNIYSLRVALSFLSRYFIELGLILFLVILTLLNEIEYLNHFINISLGSLALFGVVGLRLLPAVSLMVNSISSLVWSSNSTALIYSNLIEDRDLTLDNDIQTQSPKIPGDIKVSKDDKSISVEVKNGEISYSSSLPILKNINITLEIGSIVSVIGSSGSGKSSLGKLFAGLMPLRKGDILINNKNINSKKQLMNLFHYVPQKPFVFEGNIFENITFKLLENANSTVKDDVKRCLVRAGLKDSRWLNPSFKIFDGGKNLSGGEVQRIALARALYHTKPFIILDEFTSSLDEKTELLVLDQIKELSKDHCFVIITHRKSAIPYSREIIEVKSGFANIIPNKN